MLTFSALENRDRNVVGRLVDFAVFQLRIIHAEVLNVLFLREKFQVEQYLVRLFALYTNEFLSQVFRSLAFQTGVNGVAHVYCVVKLGKSFQALLTEVGSVVFEDFAILHDSLFALIGIDVQIVARVTLFALHLSFVHIFVITGAIGDVSLQTLIVDQRVALLTQLA